MFLSNKQIFLVEDNLSNSVIMKIILEASGAKVHQDRLGVNTVSRIKEIGHIDLVIMDLMLPGAITGYDVFDQLQADAELASIPVIIVSASEATLELKKAWRKGFRGYISKPINNHTFARTIADVLAGREVWNENDHLPAI
jgi:two-component system, sensor histidine kinase and response regulator